MNRLVMKTVCPALAPVDTREGDDQVNVIEGLIYEALPSINKHDADRLARRLSILLSKESSGLKGPVSKQQLKLLCMRPLRVARKKRQPSLSLISDAATKENAANKEEKSALFDNRNVVNTKAKVERHHELMNIVGEANYNEIIDITNQIKDIRKSSSLWTKFSHHFVDSLKVEEERLPASQGLPPVLSDIYFRTRLVDVMRIVDSTSIRTLQETPVPCACIVKNVDWNDLLRDAKEKLLAFRAFEQENNDDVEQRNLLLCPLSSCLT